MTPSYDMFFGFEHRVPTGCISKRLVGCSGCARLLAAPGAAYCPTCSLKILVALGTIARPTLRPSRVKPDPRKQPICSRARRLELMGRRAARKAEVTAILRQLEKETFLQ